MITLYERAPAKLNLTLDVLNKREDGYHDLRSVMQTVTLFDDVEITLYDSSEKTGWRVETSEPELPRNEENLAWKAAQVFFAGSGMQPGLHIYIEKRIPAGAGLAGGSADAAAVLRALNRQYGLYSEPKLAQLALQVGSDVPFCLVGGTMLAEGRGEILTPLPAMPECEILIVKPQASVSTAALFQAIDEQNILLRPDTDAFCKALAEGNLKAIASLIGNVFEPIAMRLYPQIGEVLGLMRHNLSTSSAMTGTGSACFGLYSDFERAARTRAAMSGMNVAVFPVRPV